MLITTINIDVVKEIETFMSINFHDCSILLSIVHGNITNQKITEDTKSIIIDNVSKDIATIVISCQRNKVKSISFYGTIDISPKELMGMFKTYRESYSPRDDLYFYFFNEDKKHGNYTISFFDPLHNQINVSESNERLSNLILS